MQFGQLKAVFTAPNKLALFSLMGMLKGHMRLLCHAALAQSGILNSLSSPKSLHELKDALGLSRDDLLKPLLNLAVSLKILRRSGHTYACKGALAKAIAGNGEVSGKPLAAFLQEQVYYHNQVFRDLPKKLTGDADSNYLASVAPLISEGSRMIEAFLRPFVRNMTRGLAEPNILEVGCGDAAYIPWYVDDCPGAHGVAIDIDETVVARARKTLDAGNVDSFQVVHGDILDPPETVVGPFELVTLIQNVYYFADEQRIELFEWSRSRLSAKGRLAIVSTTGNERMIGHYFSLLLGSTQGCHPPPTCQRLEEELQLAGFKNIQKSRLIPFDDFWGILAEC